MKISRFFRLPVPMKASTFFPLALLCTQTMKQRRLTSSSTSLWKRLHQRHRQTLLWLQGLLLDQWFSLLLS